MKRIIKRIIALFIYLILASFFVFGSDISIQYGENSTGELNPFRVRDSDNALMVAIDFANFTGIKAEFINITSLNWCNSTNCYTLQDFTIDTSGAGATLDSTFNQSYWNDTEDMQQIFTRAWNDSMVNTTEDYEDDFSRLIEVYSWINGNTSTLDSIYNQSFWNSTSDYADDFAPIGVGDWAAASGGYINTTQFGNSTIVRTNTTTNRGNINVSYYNITELDCLRWKSGGMMCSSP